MLFSFVLFLFVAECKTQTDKRQLMSLKQTRDASTVDVEHRTVYVFVLFLRSSTERGNLLDVTAHVLTPRQAQKAAGQWPGWKVAGPPPKSVNPPVASGRPPKMNYDPDDDPWAVGSAAPKADPPILQIYGNVQQGTLPINLSPAARHCNWQVWISRAFSCRYGNRIEIFTG